jgi:hypothetical protein
MRLRANLIDQQDIELVHKYVCDQRSKIKELQEQIQNYENTNKNELSNFLDKITSIPTYIVSSSFYDMVSKVVSKHESKDRIVNVFYHLNNSDISRFDVGLCRLKHDFGERIVYFTKINRQMISVNRGIGEFTLEVAPYEV